MYQNHTRQPFRGRPSDPSGFLAPHDNPERLSVCLSRARREVL